ncbi:MAG: hypothetical protein J6S63_00215, partial [Atopobiaceae bacterium]|nr:hypothetical protein [Atopobiaceae bacterium]
MSSSRVTAARKVALQVLGEVRRRDARVREVLRASKRMEALEQRDRAQVTRLVMGVAGARGMLDTVIDGHVRARSGVEPQVRDALRIASYELLFLSTPASVAVSQGVELVRGVRPRAAGMANAVLRRIAEEDVPKRTEALGRVGGEHRSHIDVADLELVSGYPPWLLDRIRTDRGDEACVSVALAALEPAPVYVAPNLAKIDASTAFERLTRAGLEPHALEEDDSFVLAAPAGLHVTGLVQNADVIPADLSAQRVAHLVVPEQGGRLLEVGQGRGTKSLLMQNEARRRGVALDIAGVDVEPFKTEVARARMERAGLSDCVRCVTFDARELDQPSAADAIGTHEPFDVVFVDAPCSGVGTLRRHPEIAWALTPND